MPPFLTLITNCASLHVRLLLSRLLCTDRVTTGDLHRRWVWSSTAMTLAWRFLWANIREKATSSEPSRASATWEETRRQGGVLSFTPLLFLKGKFFRF